MAVRASRHVPKGHATPRLSPPAPLKHGAKDYRAFAEGLGISLYPWQETAAKYLTAVGPNGRWLYREVAVIVSRQNGKTKLLVPLIIQRLLDGQRVMHTAQNAKLPRDVHEEVATLLQEHYPESLPSKRAISYAVGHEEIRLRNGGRYRIVAPTKGGARGPANDLVIVDELREMEDYGFIGAAKPTLTKSRKPQMVYLSNAGTDDSLVLNSIKARAAEDPVLAYLEWSASPDRSADDILGWEESNPTLGHDESILETLTTEYRTNFLAGTLGIFETEHLCRWVPTLREKFVDEQAWADCRGEVPRVLRPSLAVSLDPEGARADVVMAWRTSSEEVALSSVIHEAGDNIDTDAIAEKVRDLASKYGAEVGFDPLTDGVLVKHVRKGKAISINGAKYAVASAGFVNAVATKRVVWSAADAVTDDLTWTSRKPDGDQGSFHAVRAKDDRPITAALAAVRAVYLASLRRSGGPPEIR